MRVVFAFVALVVFFGMVRVPYLPADESAWMVNQMIRLGVGYGADTEGDAKDVEEFIPEGLLVGLLAGRAGPVA